MEIQYKYTEKFTPEVIEEIITVQKEKGLTAENLIETAKIKSNPLHKLFDWDDSSAAEKWRLHYARNLINEVKVIIDTKELYAFENVNVTFENTSGENEREYKPRAEILSNEEYRRQVIASALNYMDYWTEKNKEFSEFKPIFISVNKVKKALSKKWKKKGV